MLNRQETKKLWTCVDCSDTLIPYEDDYWHDRWCDTCKLGYIKPERREEWDNWKANSKVTK